MNKINKYIGEKGATREVNDVCIDLTKTQVVGYSIIYIMITNAFCNYIQTHADWTIY